MPRSDRCLRLRAVLGPDSVGHIGHRRVELLPIRARDAPRNWDTRSERWAFANRGARTAALFSPLDVPIVRRVDDDLLALVDERRHLNDDAILQSRRLVRRGCRGAAHHRLRFGDLRLHGLWEVATEGAPLV